MSESEFELSSEEKADLPAPAVLSAFWFGTAFHWLALLLIAMPADVVGFMGEQNKGMYLGVLTAIGAVIALVLPPIVGARSDATKKRMSYLKTGLAINILGLGVMALAVAFLLDGIGFSVYIFGLLMVQFGNNYATAPYSALIPQLIPTEQRGRYSGVMGMLQALGQLAAALATFIFASLYLPDWSLYILIALALLVPASITLRGVREESFGQSPELARPPIGFSPKPKLALGFQQMRQLFAHPAFFWVFWTRVLFALGQYSVQPFLNYYNRDVLLQKNPEQSTSMMLGVIIIASIFSAYFGGKLSDRIGRKPMMYLAGAAMAMAAVALLLTSNYTAALLIAFGFGLGFGAFSSVDWALGSDAMPSQDSYARDMGIWHVAFVAPQFVSLPMGSLLDGINAGGGTFGYTVVFGMAAMFFILGILLVRNIPEKPRY